MTIVFLGLIAAYFFYNQSYHQTTNKAETDLTPDQQQIIKIGYKCLDFGDRAVAKDIPTIEFQRLERISKRANIISNCMQDNGYQVNPAWTQYAEPVARAEAKKTNISFDEAITNLSRKDMQVFEPKDSRPDYWVKNKAPKQQ